MSTADERRVVVPSKWWEALPRPAYSELERVESSQPWFEVYRAEPDVYVIYEPGQSRRPFPTSSRGRRGPRSSTPAAASRTSRP